MIKLDIQGYCQSCRDFEPDVTRPEKLIIKDYDDNSLTIQTDTIIQCRYAKRCENIRRYLNQKILEAANRGEQNSEKSD